MTRWVMVVMIRGSEELRIGATGVAATAGLGAGLVEEVLTWVMMGAATCVAAACLAGDDPGVPLRVGGSCRRLRATEL